MPLGHPAAEAFGRVVVAMVTPFDTDGDLDLDAAAALAERLVAGGCDGLVINGTTGESPTTSDVEKESVLRAVLEAVGDRARVVFGAGSNDTAHSVHLARIAEKAGAHGTLVVTPYYNKPPADGLLAHFNAVADATELPVMLYDIPGRTGLAIPTDVLLRCAEHPRILAVKDAKGDLFAAAEVMTATDLAFYSGDDALNWPWLAVGALGVVSVVGHVAAGEYAQMVAAADAGDLRLGRDLHLRLVPAVTGVMSHAQGAIAAKAVLAHHGFLSAATVRLPLLTASADLTEQIVDDVNRSGLAMLGGGSA
jgi:4-hydroxy-tetrahydrodipicolinate synthase